MCCTVCKTGLIIIKENQALRYVNLMTFDCWEMLKKFGKIVKNPLYAHKIFTLIDKDLLAITTYVQNKATNEARKCIYINFLIF